MKSEKDKLPWYKRPSIEKYRALLYESAGYALILYPIWFVVAGVVEATADFSFVAGIWWKHPPHGGWEWAPIGMGLGFGVISDIRRRERIQIAQIQSQYIHQDEQTQDE
jgi:hypothetical protein